MTNSATATAGKTIKIEEMKAGVRYVEVIAPKFEDGWKVASVERLTSGCEVIRDGHWSPLNIVRVTYQNGISLRDEVGTDIWVECEVG